MGKTCSLIWYIFLKLNKNKLPGENSPSWLIPDCCQYKYSGVLVITITFIIFCAGPVCVRNCAGPVCARKCAGPVCARKWAVSISARNCYHLSGFDTK